MPNKKGFLIAAGLALLLLPFCNQAPDAAKDNAAASVNNPVNEAGKTQEPAKNEPSSLDAIQWIRQDFKSALSKAEADGKLMMVDVYTTWCGPCKMLDKNTFPAKEVVDKAANFVTLKLDAEAGDGPELQKKYNVQGYPTILFIDGKGNLVHSVIGYMDPAALVAEMDKALSKAG